MQIIADTHGNCVWVGERDCSAQRRHQKLIEESPAPEFPADIRQAMGEAAVKVAKACGYTNAGTVEFLFQDGDFFFLEMNTRLQVEHPVTELVSGIDLVREQIRVASGEPLSFSQDDIDLRGHAIEVRVNAEDPAGGKFLPAPGRITKLIPPQGFGTRWDGGYESGDEVSQYYDNLVGKLIVWGSDRTTAIDRMKRAVREFRIEGVKTTLPADLAILEHQDFVDAKHSTKWVEDTLDLSAVGVDEPAAGCRRVARRRRRRAAGPPGRRRRGQRQAVQGGGVGARDGRRGRRRRRRRRPAAAPRPKRAGGAAGAAVGVGSGSVTVPMQGTIVKVDVAVGDTVELGQAVCTMEAMKMENTIAADIAGVVAEVRVEPGQAVGAGDVVAVITAPPSNFSRNFLPHTQSEIGALASADALAGAAKNGADEEEAWTSRLSRRSQPVSTAASPTASCPTSGSTATSSSRLHAQGLVRAGGAPGHLAAGQPSRHVAPAAHGRHVVDAGFAGLAPHRRCAAGPRGLQLGPDRGRRRARRVAPARGDDPPVEGPRRAATETCVLGIPCTSLVRTLVDLPAVTWEGRCGTALDLARRARPVRCSSG